MESLSIFFDNSITSHMSGVDSSLILRKYNGTLTANNLSHYLLDMVSGTKSKFHTPRLIQNGVAQLDAPKCYWLTVYLTG
jgi:hypothetical protein